MDEKMNFNVVGMYLYSSFVQNLNVWFLTLKCQAYECIVGG